MPIRSMVFALLAGSLSQAAIAQGQDVNVVNTPDVNVANTPDVRIVGLPTITIEDDVVESYIADSFAEDSPVFPATNSLCYFDVPAGKVLHIENISGFTRKGNVVSLSIQPDPRGGGTAISSFRIPRAVRHRGNYLFDADGAVYAGDEDIFTDSTDSLRDFRVIIDTDGAGADKGLAHCIVTGRLFSANP